MRELNTNNVLKWLLLFTVVGCFISLIISTKKTYDEAPPIPNQIVDTNSNVIMTSSNIIAGKGGFQQADLMDYGSIFGMGASFGIDYTAQYVHQLGLKVKDTLAQNKFHMSYASLAKEDQASIDYVAIQKLHNLHLTEEKLVVDPTIADAIVNLRTEVSASLLKTEKYTGYTKAYSLNPQTSLYTADFLIYSALITVINRPNETHSYTNNWPYDPSVGNVATTETFTKLGTLVWVPGRVFFSF